MRLELKVTGFLLAIMMAATSMFAQSTTTYDFLRNDVGARAGALGGGFMMLTDDPNLIFYNPAGLATLTQRRVSFGFFKHLLDINSGYASFGTEIPNFGFVGAGVVYINYGEFKRTGAEGQDLGTFGAGEFALTGGYAGTLQPGLYYGANVKFIYSKIDEVQSSAAALDFGVQYVAITNRMTLGASLLNLGTQLNPYETTRENLPTDLTIGMALYPEHLPAAILLNLHKLTDSYESFSQRMKAFSVGIEFTPGPNVHLRLGYNNERRQELKIVSGSGLAGFSIGGGINTDAYSVDYAFTSLGQVGSVHRISVTF
ncbi:MAG: type IX secretion system protein PorQ [Ignavibacteriae bacterium]|nr:type IX secretion system protein PorQ [Ignavibacteria bacterium]MBI3363404.1 type IX secretion system protein PorQ [Ignavibacteriota bacterium]